jgi:hypothetical protein
MTGLRNLVFVSYSRACHTFQLRGVVEAVSHRTLQLKPMRPCSSQQRAAHFASVQQHVREPGGLRTSKIGPQEHAANIFRAGIKR